MPPPSPKQSKAKLRSKRMLAVYAEQSVRCAVCYWRKHRPGRECHLHHIVGRRGSDPHHHRNIIMLCARDHDRYHSDLKFPLSLGQILQAKQDEDGEVDLVFLSSLLGRRGLRESLLPLPGWAIEERVSNANQ